MKISINENEIKTLDSLEQIKQLEEAKAVEIIKVEPTQREVVRTNNEQLAISVLNDNADLIQTRLQALDNVAQKIKDSLNPDIDYMVIPGTSKPSLLLSGAERIALAYGLRQEADIIDKTIDLDNGVVRYHYRVKLYTMGEGRLVAEGEGSCSSLEKKWVAQKSNPFEVENTIIKIARKRAFVGAVISIGNISKVFTQDMEDMKNNEALDNAVKLGKNEALELYSTAYSILIDNYHLLSVKQKAEAKDKVKQILPLIFKEAKIEKMNFLGFSRGDKKAFLDYLNTKGVTEK